jgi:hypothetical protein
MLYQKNPSPDRNRNSNPNLIWFAIALLAIIVVGALAVKYEVTG